MSNKGTVGVTYDCPVCSFRYIGEFKPEFKGITGGYSAKHNCENCHAELWIDVFDSGSVDINHMKSHLRWNDIYDVVEDVIERHEALWLAESYV